MRCLGIFTSILLEVATTNLFCVQPRETKLKTRGPITSNIFFSCFKKITFTSIVTSGDEQNGPGSNTLFSHILTKGFFAVAQRLLRYIFSRVITRHIDKFKHLGTTTLVTSNWLVTVAKPSPFPLQSWS